MNCSGTVIQPDSSLNLFNRITYIPLFFFGAAFNIIALFIFCCRLPKWTETTVFLVNLMVADILIVLTLPFRIYAFFYKWNLSVDLCRTLTMFYFVNTYISIFTISSIAFDRYLAISKPLKYKASMSPIKACVTCCFFWALFIAIGILRNLYINNGENSKTCFIKVNTDPNKMNLAFAGIGFFLPLLFICFCSRKVMKNLRVKVSLNPKEQNALKKARNIITSNLVIFVVCFLPIHVGYVVRFVAESSHASCSTLKSISVFINVATFIANANCVLDAICYYFAASEVRSALSKQIFPMCSLKCCSK
ncbi:G-protein coupled receptor 35-like [Mantella aurantiaca]